MMEPRLLLGDQQIRLILKRFAYQLMEQHPDMEALALIGLQPRGVVLSRLVYEELNLLGLPVMPHYGELDITFFRDDFNRGELLVPKKNDINFSTENKQVVLIDDVLFTGRSVRSALDALLSFGRPAKVSLMVLVDRRYSRELPIAPDYTGIAVDTRVKLEQVKVSLTENDYKVWIRETKQG
jgi:pyrimidine operon attenuation protein/uracil phosphoribosyltransferase